MPRSTLYNIWRFLVPTALYLSKKKPRGGFAEYLRLFFVQVSRSYQGSEDATQPPLWPLPTPACGPRTMSHQHCSWPAQSCWIGVDQICWIDFGSLPCLCLMLTGLSTVPVTITTLLSSCCQALWGAPGPQGHSQPPSQLLAALLLSGNSPALASL